VTLRRVSYSNGGVRGSRDPADLVAQTIGPVHQYPDGFALLLGTMFAPVKNRDAPGQGFTHKRDDIVTIATPQLGKLINRMRSSDDCEPRTFGVGALMKNLGREEDFLAPVPL
jgi:fumarylacetoacetate (FAA) hydrolase family protein